MNVRAFLHPGYEKEQRKCDDSFRLDYLLNEENIQEIKDDLIVNIIKLSNTSSKYMNLGIRETFKIPNVDEKLEKYLEYNKQTKDLIELTCSRKFGLTIDYLCIPSKMRLKIFFFNFIDEYSLILYINMFIYL